MVISAGVNIKRRAFNVYRFNLGEMESPLKFTIVSTRDIKWIPS
jgi:hypothetical protein